MRIGRHLALTLVSAALSTVALAQDARPAAPEWQAKVDPWVLSTAAASGSAEFLVFLAEQADLRGADLLVTKEARGRFVFERLRATASATQGPLLDLLQARGVEHQPFWVANMVKVTGDLGLVEELALRDDVAHVYANPVVHLQEPVVEEPEERAPEAIEPGVLKIRAPEVWATGYRGDNVVVAGQDTGYDWDHPALIGKYRGWNGSAADHNYNWHDAIHGCGPNSSPPCGGSCGLNSLVPCDDQSHGTHTMGTMVGDDGGSNQVGVAPDARWIGCRNMDRGDGSPATYSECFQWFIAPTNLAGQNPDPTKAPHVINNSWGCPASEGCTDPNVLKAVVDNTRAAGIMVVASAGNSGSACSTVQDPPAMYDASFSVGATSNNAN
ncbi:MAG TPA: S8 family serine peptidase, partial [Vicinamibacteria bacterium]|nr:S8 family serine peptidase [Vicinamibacteria bacterium]